MAFSFGVEMLNMVMRKRMAKGKVVQLNEPQLKRDEPMTRRLVFVNHITAQLSADFAEE
jgi:hypothetical protein